MENDGLDALLDDALADFDKPVPSSSKTQTAPQQQPEEALSNNQENPPLLPPPHDVFKEFFGNEMSEKLEEEWNSAMKELQDEDPNLARDMKLLSNLENLSASNGANANTSTDVDPDSSGSVSEKVKEALESMAKSAQEDVGSDDLMKNFLNLGLDDANASGDNLPGFNIMEDMMKMMLSKDMLYPPMKEMIKNYPPWMEKNKEKTSKTDMLNYEKQLDCMKKVCNEFESEKDSDSDSVKKTRFETIMNTVNQMQQFGQPPSDLINDKTPVPQEGCLIS